MRKKPAKEIITPVSDTIRFRLHLYTEKGKVENFIRQLEILIKNRWRVIVRHNCFHGVVHRDIYSLSGVKRKEILGKFPDLKDAVKLSEKDLRENYRKYINRFIKDKDKR